MKHYRDKIEEKETETPTGRCERRQQHEDPNWDRTKHPEKSRKFVSLVNMTQAGNDTEDNCDGIASFAFCCFGRAACPITSVAAPGVFWQEMPAVWTGHFIAHSWFGPGGRCVGVLYAHCNY